MCPKTRIIIKNAERESKKVKRKLGGEKKSRKSETRKKKTAYKKRRKERI